MTSVAVNQSSNQQQSSMGQPGSYIPLQNVASEPYSPYSPAPANMASQSSNSNVVVTNQPSPAPVRVNQVDMSSCEKPNPATFIVSLILMTLCTSVGMVHLLCCFVPAVILSVVGFNYGYSRSYELKRQSRVFTQVAVGLNIAAMVFFVVSLIFTVIMLAVGLGCPRLLGVRYYYSTYGYGNYCYGY